MRLDYEVYLDKVLGGWIGKSMGGAIGARFEGNKSWIEIDPGDMFPAEMPPNDDLDLQVLWLKVLEEKGAALTSDDLAWAWLEGCWYPFNEYGIFRRNWRLGIHPPMTGRFANQFWETGMGCPIRSEIWGYVLPGAPDLAARFAWMDGTLDHTEQSVGAEQMLSAMASMAFFVPDVRRLAHMFARYLPQGTPIERSVRAAFACYDAGLSLREARERLMVLDGHPEACDAQTNVPFTFLGLLYGENDLQETLLCALRCGYDTDCTLATSGALLGQILGAKRIPHALKKPVGDALVMGIEYRRPEMTLSALARDTARLGVLLARECATGVAIDGAPELTPLPLTAKPPATRLVVEYEGAPAAAPGDTVTIKVQVLGALTAPTRLVIACPDGWRATPDTMVLDPAERSVRVALHAPVAPAEWPMRNIFRAALEGPPCVEYEFGVAGAGLYRFLGVYYDAVPVSTPLPQAEAHRVWHQHFAHIDRPYLNEPEVDEDALFERWSRILGKRAVVPSYEHEVDPAALFGLRGACCCYLARTIISPEERPVAIVVGNTDSFRIYLNGELIGEQDETAAWTPYNSVYNATLRAGRNAVLLKLIRRSDGFRFTLGIRLNAPRQPGHDFNCCDWLVDLSDAAP